MIQTGNIFFTDVVTLQPFLPPQTILDLLKLKNSSKEKKMHMYITINVQSSMKFSSASYFLLSKLISEFV